MNMDCIDFIDKVKHLMKTDEITILILNSNNVVSRAIYTTIDTYSSDIQRAEMYYETNVIDFWFQENKLLIWAKKGVVK
jgi:hypothetical protein